MLLFFLIVGFVLNENRPDGDPAVRVIQQFEAQLKAHQVCDWSFYVYTFYFSFFAHVSYAVVVFDVSDVKYTMFLSSI